jgi:hypothetical protein
MNGLFINQTKSNCSIYEGGVTIFNALKSDKYNLSYLEVPSIAMNSYDYSGYDFYIINWHHNTLPMAKSTINRIKGLKIGILLEVGSVELKPFMPHDLFDAYMVLDPTKEKHDKYYVFPRPLEKVDKLLPLLSDEIPVFGTFGFLVPGKDFNEVLTVVSGLDRECILRMNFPNATYTGQNPLLARDFAKRLHENKGNKVDLRVTFDYMTKPDLIKWCSQHTINIFPYYRTLPGLSAVTDQAIVANRGIAITDCDTFRHMHKYISYYPKYTYLDLAENTLPGIKQMQEDWSNENFVLKFKELLSERMN